MTLQETILADLASISAEYGSPVFTWNGTDYECIPSTANQGSEADIGGFNTDADLTITVRSDLFYNNVYPEAQKSLITYNGDRYRVIRIGWLNHGAAIRLHCVNEFRLK